MMKQHKRRVSRAKERVKLSEPDLRTTEQIKADREASRPTGSRGSDGILAISTPAFRNSPGHGSAAKTDV